MNKTALVAAAALAFGGLALTGCPDREERPAEPPPTAPPPAAETEPPPGEPMPARDQMDERTDPATRPVPTPDAPAGEGVGPDGA